MNPLRLHRARQIIAENAALVDRICADCHLPPACLKAVMMMEIPSINFSDSVADVVVGLNWFRFSLFHSFHPDRHTRNPFRKYDSSTGCGQIFAQVAIEAILFGKQLGLPIPSGLPEALSPTRPEDLQLVWRRLHSDRAFNLSCAALNLLHAAFQMTGRVDFGSFSPEEVKLVFSRYNGNVKHITAYGEQAYLYYLEFSGA